MSQPLAPCPSCNRHVFADACACPFCEAKLRVCEAARTVAPNAHLSRAARLAAGAALVGVAACGSAVPKPPYGAPPPHDASADTAADSGAAGGAGGTQGAPDGSPPDASTDRSVVPLYGAAAPVLGKPVR